MASIYKPTYTKPIPAGADIVTRKGRPHAQFRDRKGRLRAEPLTKDGTKLLVEQKKWYIRCEDVDGRVRRIPGFRDKVATEQKASELERQVELRRAGVIAAAEAKLSEQLKRPLGDHIQEYDLHLQAKGTTDAYRKEKLRHLNAFFDASSVLLLPDITATKAERFLKGLLDEGCGPRTHNLYLESLRGFLS